MTTLNKCKLSFVGFRIVNGFRDNGIIYVGLDVFVIAYLNELKIIF